MADLHFRTCPLCEAMCGLALSVSGTTITSIAGDPDDPVSRGYLCPKAVALKDIHDDPRRLRTPHKRHGDRWEAISWPDAVDEVADRFAAIQAAAGPDSVAFYSGNPNLHSYGAQLSEVELEGSLRSRALFSTASMDHLPHLMAAFHMFGSQFLLPVPDVDRAAFVLVVGANPAVSNGSLMTAPGAAARLTAVRARGGQVVVVDPCRTRTAALANRHLFIRPGTDAWLLLAMLQTIFAEGLAATGRVEGFTDGLDLVSDAVRPHSPDVAADRTGIPAESIRQLAREFAGAPSAVCYGRLGVCTQEFGALTCWLTLVLNVVTGNLDRPGGAMFSRPPVDVVRVGGLMGQQGSWAGSRSRLRHLPEFAGRLPVAVLAEEIDTPGPGRIRALLTSAGNPVLSTPNGARLERALAGLDFMASIDFYINETTRFANIILPPAGPLERDHFDLSFHTLAVRNSARYAQPVFAVGAQGRTDWQINLDLAAALDARRGTVVGWARWLRRAALRRVGATTLLDVMLRLGPYGDRFNPFGRGLSVRRLLEMPHGVDLGPLQPCLPGRLQTPRRRINLAPAIFVADLQRLGRHDVPWANRPGEFRMIGRRLLRSNNSWMHHVPRLTKGPSECTLLMHPEDARASGFESGETVRVRSRVGDVALPIEVSDTIMRGVVSLPHGFGHARPDGWRSAATHCGVSANDLTDESRVDELSGTIAFNGLPVRVERCRAARLPPESA